MTLNNPRTVPSNTSNGSLSAPLTRRVEHRHKSYGPREQMLDANCNCWCKRSLEWQVPETSPVERLSQDTNVSGQVLSMLPKPQTPYLLSGIMSCIRHICNVNCVFLHTFPHRVLIWHGNCQSRKNPPSFILQSRPILIRLH